MKKRLFNNKYSSNNNGFSITKIVGYLFLITISVLIIFFIFNINIKKNSIVKDKENYYKEKFVNGNYLNLIDEISSEIKRQPFNKEYRLYRAYSYFLQGEEEEEYSKRRAYFLSSLFDIRKAIALNLSEENFKNSIFILGKIYFYLGDAYYNLSLKYLLDAKNEGLQREDLYYTLSVLYSYMGNYKEALKNLLEALKFGDKDILLLAIGNAYYNISDFDNAKKFLENCISKSTDTRVKIKAYSLLGEIFFKTNKYNDSLECFNKVIELDENIADAYYYRGEIYSKQNKQIQARAEWRKVLEIDPGHIKALKRVY